MGWGARSEIRGKLLPDPDPGVEKTPDPGSRSATLLESQESVSLLLKASIHAVTFQILGFSVLLYHWNRDETGNRVGKHIC
jgi:hypothetical protein